MEKQSVKIENNYVEDFGYVMESAKGTISTEKTLDVFLAEIKVQSSEDLEKTYSNYGKKIWKNILDNL